TLAAKEYSWNEKPIHGVMFDCHMSCHLVVIDDIYEALNKDTLNTRDRAGDSKSLGKRLALLHHEDAGCLLEELYDIAHNAAITFIMSSLCNLYGAGIGIDLLHKMDIISGTLGKGFDNIGDYCFRETDRNE
ncbi:hypothetical protein HN011_001604, partial [Eciton burchellii]